MPKRALVAGASGALGSKVAAELAKRGFIVRGLTRDKARAGSVAEAHVGDALLPETLKGAAGGVDVVFSALGASVSAKLGAGWAPFTSVDVRANTALLDEAKRAGVKRFVYVSVFHGEAMAGTPYIRAHEEVVKRIEASGLEFAIIRPTGFFAALADALLEMAQAGRVPSLGDGQTKSNPIDEADLAVVCADACEGGDTFIAAGGPEVLTREQMTRAAFAALGKPVKLLPAPVFMAKVGAVMMRPFLPRMSQMTSFLAALAEHDAVAPVRGTRTLSDYFAAAVARSSSRT